MSHDHATVIWANSERRIDTPERRDYEAAITQLMRPVLLGTSDVEDVYERTDDPGLLLGLAVRHGLHDLPREDDPSRLVRALAQVVAVMGARMPTTDESLDWALARVTALAYGDTQATETDELTARVLGASDEVRRIDARLALLLELTWECGLPGARKHRWVRARQLLLQAAVVLRGKDAMLARVLRAALPWYSLPTAHRWSATAPLGGRSNDGCVFVWRSEWASHWTSLAMDLGVPYGELADVLEPVVDRMALPMRSRCSTAKRRRVVEERRRILAAFRAEHPERVKKLIGSDAMEDLPGHITDFSAFFEVPRDRSEEMFDRATARSNALVVPVLRTTMPQVVVDAMADADAWRERLRACGLAEGDCTFRIEPKHADLARDRQLVAPRRLVIAPREPQLAQAA